MGSGTLVCVKRVKQEAPGEWDESMPLPGDIIEGVAEDYDDEVFLQAKARSELSAQLGKISQHVDLIRVKVRRGDSTLKLRVNVVRDKCSLLHKRFTIKASADARHVAVLGDLTLEQCTELQAICRNEQEGGECGVKYDWKLKMEAYLPNRTSSVISSILFHPMQVEYCVEAITARCTAWFSAAISSGVPLVFVNIQTEQTITPERTPGIRLWFLPGIAEILLEMTLEPGDTRFGIDIKRTDEGFICVYSVTKGSAADRAGIGDLYEEANTTGHLLIISRLEGKSLMPSSVCSSGLVQCCDQNEIRATLVSGIEKMDSIRLHFMSWPDQTVTSSNRSVGLAALLPPQGSKS